MSEKSGLEISPGERAVAVGEIADRLVKYVENEGEMFIPHITRGLSSAAGQEGGMGLGRNNVEKGLTVYESVGRRVVARDIFNMAKRALAGKRYGTANVLMHAGIEVAGQKLIDQTQQEYDDEVAAEEASGKKGDDSTVSDKDTSEEAEDGEQKQILIRIKDLAQSHDIFTIDRKFPSSPRPKFSTNITRLITDFIKNKSLDLLKSDIAEKLNLVSMPAANRELDEPLEADEIELFVLMVYVALNESPVLNQVPSITEYINRVKRADEKKNDEISFSEYLIPDPENFNVEAWFTESEESALAGDEYPEVTAEMIPFNDFLEMEINSALYNKSNIFLTGYGVDEIFPKIKQVFEMRGFDINEIGFLDKGSLQVAFLLELKGRIDSNISRRVVLKIVYKNEKDATESKKKTVVGMSRAGYGSDVIYDKNPLISQFATLRGASEEFIASVNEPVVTLDRLELIDTEKRSEFIRKHRLSLAYLYYTLMTRAVIGEVTDDFFQTRVKGASEEKRKRDPLLAENFGVTSEGKIISIDYDVMENFDEDKLREQIRRMEYLEEQRKTGKIPLFRNAEGSFSFRDWALNNGEMKGLKPSIMRGDALQMLGIKSDREKLYKDSPAYHLEMLRRNLGIPRYADTQECRDLMQKLDEKFNPKTD